MLTLRDVIDYSNLTEEEVDTIAAHEHVPKIVAAEIACQLVQSPAGAAMLEQMILEVGHGLTGRGDERQTLAKSPREA